MISPNIGQPWIIQEAGSNQPTVQKDAWPEAGSSNWLKGSFVYTSGTGASTVLNKLASAGTVIYGQSPDAAKGVVAPSIALQPPNSLFGLLHYCFDPRDRIFEMNIANASASGAQTGTTSGVTWAGGGTSGVALAPGQQYGVVVPTSGTYVNVQFIDVTNTTQKLFEIVRLAPGVSVDDNNPRVWARVISTVIQG